LVPATVGSGGETLQIWQLMVLAVVQGLTEFFPISSTAHLAVIPRLFHWKDPGLAFDVALHVGTLFAVLIYFASTWNKVLRAALQKKRLEGTDAITHEHSVDRRLGWFVIVATIPAMISGVLLQRAAETSLRTLPVMGACS
jgi:undecaprenyl-diphosphatase